MQQKKITKYACTKHVFCQNITQNLIKKMHVALKKNKMAKKKNVCEGGLKLFTMALIRAKHIQI